MNPQNPKKLIVKKKNIFLCVGLIVLLSIVGPFFIDPTSDQGQNFYPIMGILTGLMFPWVGVEDVKS